MSGDMKVPGTQQTLDERAGIEPQSPGFHPSATPSWLGDVGLALPPL